eukprot:SAG11_NODE_3397_length_2471_cov_2.713744_3_plen_64_part_00
MVVCVGVGGWLSGWGDHVGINEDSEEPEWAEERRCLLDEVHAAVPGHRDQLQWTPQHGPLRLP